MSDEHNDLPDVVEAAADEKNAYRKPELVLLGKVAAATFGSALGFVESGQQGTFRQ